MRSEVTFSTHASCSLEGKADCPVTTSQGLVFHLGHCLRGGSQSTGVLTLSTWERQQQHNPLFTLARAANATPQHTHFKVARIKGDGRCMFRALALGMALNKGTVLPPHIEEQDADNLRKAVGEALCTNDAHRKQYPEALISLSAEDTLPRYCKRLARQDFWGGEVELLVLSKMLKVPIIVYQSMTELTGRGGGFRELVHFGEEYGKSSKQRKGRRPVRLLYTGGNHYDLLH